MNERDRFEKIIKKLPHEHHSFFARPHGTRRQFFRNVAAGVSGFCLANTFAPSEARAQGSVEPKGTAKNVIFLFLQGAPSHVDLFDFKELPGVTPADFAPETFNGVTIPMGLLGNTARVIDKVAIIRSGLAWARAHPLAQTWVQIGRNPTSATGRIAPHIGSVVAIEKDPTRRPDQAFPAFIALNSAGAPGAGYFPVEYGPFRTAPTGVGLADADHPLGQQTFDTRWELLQQMDGNLRGPNSAFGMQASGMGDLYENARRLMFNPAVTEAFSYSDEESVRYGGTTFGNAVLTARKVIEADQGTRFIQITSNGWDHHGTIYSDGPGRNIYNQSAEFDPAFAALIEDLDAAGKLDETLIVVCGEFGRTPGQLSAGRQGRDHYLQMFYAFAGGGVKGGTVVGATNDTGGRGPGSFTVDPGWSQFRDIRPEDVEATIYSALGIDWTTVRTDDPLGRGFYYVPLSDEAAYAPVHELWG
jgi:hypothetical protein